MTKHDAMCGIPEIHGYDDYDCSCDFIQRIEKRTKERIIKLLEEHVWQLEVKHKILGFKWKQRCRCGFYGVFNKHLIALIKGENK